MKNRLLGFSIMLLVAASLFANNMGHTTVAAQSFPDVYVGIDAAYGDSDMIKALVDNVSSYTNLFVVGCTAITSNRARLDETCQYLYDKGLYFIIFQEDALGRRPFLSTASNWLQTAKNQWGNHFLGFYYMDELGGKQLDQSSWSSINSADNYGDMTDKYVELVNFYVNWFKQGYTNWSNVSLFTSDYGLYWYDYKGGYDTLLAQYGWNTSRQLNTALCRGAATAQNKDWGAIITWTYTTPPYLETGTQLYDDMIYAYNSGAKYIVVFDSNEEYTQGTLMQEHLDAIKQFWSYVQDNPRENNTVASRTAVVLPATYGYGLRGPEDKIWGLWPTDNVSYALCVGVNYLLEQYGSKLDIIYDDGLNYSTTSGYSSLIYWNDTSKFPTGVPTSAPSTAQSPLDVLVQYIFIAVSAVALTALAIAAIIVLVLKKRLIRKSTVKQT
jgi:hypothetical protein